MSTQSGAEFQEISPLKTSRASLMLIGARRARASRSSRLAMISAAVKERSICFTR